MEGLESLDCTEKIKNKIQHAWLILLKDKSWKVKVVKFTLKVALGPLGLNMEPVSTVKYQRGRQENRQSEGPQMWPCDIEGSGLSAAGQLR